MHHLIAGAVATHSIAASIGLFNAAIAAFPVVAVRDVVAWGLYVFRPAHAVVARPIGGPRVVRAASSANVS